MARLLMRHSIVELEQLFSFAKGDIKTLQALEDELKHRNVPRAVALLDKVQRALRTTKPTSKSPEGPEPAPKPTVNGASQQRTLWGQEPKRVPKPVVITTANQPAKTPSVAGPAEPPIKPPASTVQPTKLVELMPSISTDEAYKVLKATPGATWEAIEQTRRQLVQLAHPETVSGLSPERRAQVQADAKRANAAYAVLLQARTRDNQG
jgi:DnaJ-domain-containing protein 1